MRVLTHLVIVAAVAAASLTAAHADDPPFKKYWPKALRKYAKSRTLADKVTHVRSMTKRKRVEEVIWILDTWLFEPRYRHSVDVQIAFVQELADPKFKKTVPSLLKHLKKAKDPLLEIEIVDTLGEIGDEAAVDPLSKFLRRTQLILVRHILQAYRKIKARSSVKPLIAFLRECFPPKQARDAGEGGSPQFNWRRFRELKRPFLDTMQTLTRERFDIQEDWQAWYNDHKKEYEKKK